MPVRCFDDLSGRQSGDGRINVVLSHGFGTDQDAWSALRPWLDAHFRVTSFDLPGCGQNGAQSYDFRRHSSMYGYADDLLTVLEELGIEDCIYIGHSMSCMIGAAAACTRPDWFREIVMIGGSPRYLNDGDYHGGFERADLDGLFDSMAANFQAWVAGFAPMVVGVEDNAAIEEFSRTLFAMRPDIALATSRTIFESDMRALLPKLKTPTHIVQTAQDMAVPVAVGEWLHDAIPRSTLEIIDATGHLPHMTAVPQIQAMLERRLGAFAA
ncbi:MAG: alpha/beta hydrolase [Sphingobium sp.]